MLKITVHIESGKVILALEGRLAGPWVKEVELCWHTADATEQNYPLRVDLSAVSFIDPEGKALLVRMYSEGAELVAAGCLNKCIVEGIRESEKKTTREETRLC